MKTSTTTLTVADSEALEMMPRGWFKLIDVPVLLSRPAYRIERLINSGALESRIRGKYPIFVAEYHVKKPGDV